MSALIRGQHAPDGSALQAWPCQDAVLPLAGAHPLAVTASWTFRGKWEMVPGFKEFTDEGAKRQGGVCSSGVCSSSLSLKVFQVFDDACCLLSLSSEIKVGHNFFKLPCAFIPQIFIDSLLLSSSRCSLVYRIQENSTFLMVSEQHGVK